MTPEEMTKEIRNEAERNRKKYQYTADMQWDDLSALYKMLTLTDKIAVISDEEYMTQADAFSDDYDYFGWRVVTVEVDKFCLDCIVSAILRGFCFERVE